MGNNVDLYYFSHQALRKIFTILKSWKTHCSFMLSLYVTLNIDYFAQTWYKENTISKQIIVSTQHIFNPTTRIKLLFCFQNLTKIIPCGDDPALHNNSKHTFVLFLLQFAEFRLQAVVLAPCHISWTLALVLGYLQECYRCQLVTWPLQRLQQLYLSPAKQTLSTSKRYYLNLRL